MKNKPTRLANTSHREGLCRYELKMQANWSCENW